MNDTYAIIRIAGSEYAPSVLTRSEYGLSPRDALTRRIELKSPAPLHSGTYLVTANGSNQVGIFKYDAPPQPAYRLTDVKL
jgi:hypothetical protein